MNQQKFHYTHYSQRRWLPGSIHATRCGYDYPYTLLPPRRCLLEPIPEIYFAQDFLIEAAECHEGDDRDGAAVAIRKADLLEIEKWTESLWGKAATPAMLRRRIKVPDVIPKENRHKKYVPAEMKRNLLARDKFHCRWCGIPVIPKNVRDYLREEYPDELRWENTNRSKHAAFKAMTLVEDHVKPVSRGGETSLDNLIVSCWPCNSGRGNFKPEEMCLIPPIPEEGPWIESDWDGLTRVLPKG